MAGVEDFFDSDSFDEKPTGASILCTRYLRSSIPIIGGEQIYEIILNDYSDRFWACRICNKADSTLDTVDEHIHSPEHVHAAFKVYKIYDAYKAEVDAAPESEHWAIEYKHLIEHIRQVGPLQPLAYYFTNTPNDLAKTFGITINKNGVKDVVEEITDSINIVHCNSCNEVYFSEIDKEKSFQAKFDHFATVDHQRCMYINNYLKSLTLTKKEGLPATVNAKEECDLLVSAEDNIAYGPPIGFQHCIAFGGQSEYFCNICYCLIRCEHVREHFSSEAHIERFLRSKTPSNYVNIEYEPIEKRRLKIESELAGQFKEFVELHHWDAEVPAPSLLREVAFPEKRNLTLTSFATLPPNVLICDICNMCFSSKQQSWEDHVFDEHHFERLVAKQKVERDPRSFIFENSDLPRLHRQKRAHWKDQGAIHDVQNYGEYALDLIFRDVVACEYICSCCYESFPDDNPQAVIYHTRSLAHIKAALITVNPVFAAKLLTPRNEVELKAMVLDYIQNRAAPVFETKMRVFDPTTSFILNSQVKIPRILLRLSLADPDSRDAIIADNGMANYNGEISIYDDKDYLCLTTALEATNLLLTRIDSKVVVFWCNDCHTSFSAFQRDLKTIWTDHMLTELHWNRTALLKQNELGLDCLLDGTSQYQPALFDQSGIKKKIPWYWNDEKNCFQFVLNNKCHLHDVYQQYNFQGMNRVFCSLCCDIIELSEDSLTAHVRSLKHMIFYLHKYYSQDVVQLEDILADNAKEIVVARLITRDHIADKIRSSETKNSRVLLFDARGGQCQYPVIQKIVEDENRIIKLGLFKVVTKINALPSASIYSIASLHNLPTPKPNKMNIKQQVLLHMVLKNVLSDNFPDKRPASLEDLVKEVPQPAPKPKVIAPVASRVKLGFNGQINVELTSTVAPVPAPIGVPAPVLQPTGVMAPVSVMPVPVRIDEPTPMDISDDEGPIRGRRSRSRTYSPEGRYDAPSWRNIRRRSRSRSPVRLRSDDPREYSRKHEEDNWRERDRGSSRRGDDHYKRDNDPYKQQKERVRSPSSSSHRNRSPPSSRNRSPPSLSSRSSRYEKEPARRAASPSSSARSLRYEKEPSRRGTSPRKYYDDRNDESPPLPRYAEDERPSSHSSRTPRYIEQEEYSNHSRSEMMRNEEELYRQYRLANPSPTPDFNQPPPSMIGDQFGRQRPTSANGSSHIIDLQMGQQQQPQHNDPNYDKILRNLPVITPHTTILPTIDLTKPPPPLPTIRPSVFPITYGAPPPSFGMPPPGFPVGPFSGMPPPQPQQQPIDQAELVKKAKMELYNRDLIKLTGRGQLVEYLMKQSSDPIPSNDPPLLFNEVLKTKQAIVGADQVAQVLCYGEPDYETYLCIMCQYWTTVSDMFKHLKDETHRLNYMNKSYKLQHAKNNFKCNSAFLKIWPEFLDYVDNSWKLGEEEDEMPPIVAKNGSKSFLRFIINND
uniref:C2H2-type domain-containing protein n=1 Tax=Panagrolaimus superbus TaxID=310955 RepID=A0A914YWJ0_9BILA